MKHPQSSAQGKREKREAQDDILCPDCGQDAPSQTHVIE
ncbi:hypothetical protein RGAI101_132 [Roseobacter sp. GAI101]|nr:hypothetical protein RGAI101_132 [Roseobacter sp. GAI101]